VDNTVQPPATAIEVPPEQQSVEKQIEELKEKISALEAEANNQKSARLPVCNGTDQVNNGSIAEKHSTANDIAALRKYLSVLAVNKTDTVIEYIAVTNPDHPDKPKIVTDMCPNAVVTLSLAKSEWHSKKGDGVQFVAMDANGNDHWSQRYVLGVKSSTPNWSIGENDADGPLDYWKEKPYDRAIRGGIDPNLTIAAAEGRLPYGAAPVGAGYGGIGPASGIPIPEGCIIHPDAIYCRQYAAVTGYNGFVPGYNPYGGFGPGLYSTGLYQIGGLGYQYRNYGGVGFNIGFSIGSGGWGGGYYGRGHGRYYGGNQSYFSSGSNVLYPTVVNNGGSGTFFPPAVINNGGGNIPPGYYGPTPGKYHSSVLSGSRQQSSQLWSQRLQLQTPQARPQRGGWTSFSSRPQQQMQRQQTRPTRGFARVRPR